MTRRPAARPPGARGRRPRGDPAVVRPRDRADYQANGILALAKKSKANPRELAAEV
ncbi:hypothetical protein, partial [Streptomyces sp. NPDC059701]|uniref:hypothetical protein n=1 Tax=Streptomyces sp. NPDC059701 TaxID=3346914 RepID=UPI003690A250